MTHLNEDELKKGLASVNKHATKTTSGNHLFQAAIDQLTQNVKLKLFKIYQNDYKAFSYSIPNYLFNSK